MIDKLKSRFEAYLVGIVRKDPYFREADINTEKRSITLHFSHWTILQTFKTEKQHLVLLILFKRFGWQAYERHVFYSAQIFIDQTKRLESQNPIPADCPIPKKIRNTIIYRNQ